MVLYFPDDHDFGHSALRDRLAGRINGAAIQQEAKVFHWRAHQPSVLSSLEVQPHFPHI